MIGLAIGLGVASGAFSALSQSSADRAQARAIERRNAEIARSAEATYQNQLFSNEYTFDAKRANVGSQTNALVGAMAATNSARGITGSRLAETLKTNTTEQGFLQLEDLGVGEYLANLQAEFDRANTLNQRGGYQGQSMGLTLLGAGMQGLQTGLSTYGATKDF